MTFTEAVENAERAQVISDLKAARAELVARGRCTNKYVTDDGRVCLIGAVGVTTVEGFETSEYKQPTLLNYGRAFRVIRALEAGTKSLGWEAPEDFNDNPRTTDQDVLNLFDKALAELGGLA